MKNIIKGIVIAGALLAAVSCQKFLNRPTEDNYSTASFYQTDEQVLQGVNYLYASPWYDFLRAFIEASPNLKHTLHRAFDLTADPFAALETAIELGFDTILTSGQQSSARKGADLIRQLQERAAGRIEILVGAGVSAEVITELRPITGCTSFHLSAKKTLASGMVYRREGVPMGLPGFDEFSLWQTDAARVRAAKSALLA